MIQVAGLYTDKGLLESVYSLFSFLFDFTLVGGVLFFVVKFLQVQRNLRAKNELQKIQARISILRMNLKAKVKKRAHAFRSYFAKSIVARENLDRDLEEILEVRFETSADFQKYFDLIQGIHSFMVALPHLSENPIEGYMLPDEKSELVIIRIVKEIQLASQSYNTKAENYNSLNPKEKLSEIDPLVFSAMTEIDRVLTLQAEKLEETSSDSDLKAA